MKKALFALLFAPLAFAQSAPDLIIYNAKIFTGDATKKWAEAIAISGEKVSAVGSNDAIRALAADRTKRLNARGRVIIPGLNDAHEHLCTTPAFALMTGPDSTPEEVRNAVGSGADETPGDVWVSGIVGPAVLDDASMNVKALDKASMSHRVMLTSYTGHEMLVNTAAMAALRTNDSRDPAGGWWERDASGRANGKAFEYAAYNLQRRWAQDTPEEDAIEDLRTWGANAARLGVTSIQVMPCLPFNRFEKYVRHASLPIRVRVIPMPTTTNDGRDLTELRELPKASPARAMLSVSGIKWILDGTPIEHGAATRVPDAGRINFANTEIAAMLKEGVEMNQQMLFHVIGDRVTALLLELMRATGRTDWKERRVRFEHGDGLAPDLVPTAKEFGVVVVQNPTHQGPWAKTRLTKSLLKNGIVLALGSDGPPITPYADLQLAITNPSNPEEGLTREEAVEAYTRGSAYAEFTEKEKGTLEAGKLADLAVLSQDIFSISTSSIPQTTSVLTIVGGKIAYDDHSLLP